MFPSEYRLILVFVCAFFAGCASVQGPTPDDPFFAPNYPDPLEPDFENAGGISHARFGNSLFSDRKARHIGDLLTVVLTERTASSKTADTDISKADSVQLNDGVALGEPIQYEGHTLGADIDQDRQFEAESGSTQSNSLTGNITVTVTEVLPNGLLVLRGEKWLRLNQGDEYIRVTGLARDEDIGADNTIPSTKLADARISYSGTGALADSNRQGWLSRFFNSRIWPF